MHWLTLQWGWPLHKMWEDQKAYIRQRRLQAVLNSHYHKRMVGEMLGFSWLRVLSSKPWSGVSTAPCRLFIFHNGEYSTLTASRTPSYPGLWPSTSLIYFPSGLPFSFGIFQEYYSTHEPFSLEPSGIAAVGTTATVCLNINLYHLTD